MAAPHGFLAALSSMERGLASGVQVSIAVAAVVGQQLCVSSSTAQPTPSHSLPIDDGCISIEAAVHRLIDRHPDSRNTWLYAVSTHPQERSERGDDERSWLPVCVSCVAPTPGTSILTTALPSSSSYDAHMGLDRSPLLATTTIVNSSSSTSSWIRNEEQ